MNHHDHIIPMPSLDRFVAEIQREPTWEYRLSAFYGCVRAIHTIAQQRGLDEQTHVVRNELGGDLASRVIDGLGSPPITEISQYLLYTASNELAHIVAAHTWCQRHPDEMQALQRQHPNITLIEEIKRAGPAEYYLEVDDSGEPQYMRDLHGELLHFAISDAQTSPIITLRNWMRDLAQQYRLGQLRSRDGTTIPRTDDADTEMVNVAELYLKGALIPADADTELAMKSTIERLSQDYGDILRTLFVMAGRQ